MHTGTPGRHSCPRDIPARHSFADLGLWRTSGGLRVLAMSQEVTAAGQSRLANCCRRCHSCTGARATLSLRLWQFQRFTSTSQDDTFPQTKEKDKARNPSCREKLTKVDNSLLNIIPGILGKAHKGRQNGV